MEIIEQVDQWRDKYRSWASQQRSDSELKQYPFVENKRAPFTAARRALPMLNLALISSAGAYIDGTAPFETNNAAGDMNIREIPTEIDVRDLRFAARGYDPKFVQKMSTPKPRLPGCWSWKLIALLVSSIRCSGVCAGLFPMPQPSPKPRCRNL